MSRPSPALVAGVLFFLGTAGAGCDLVRDRSRPSILLVTVDTLRPDRIGAYGHPTNRTPAMDKLAAEGARFPVAYCDMPWTTGSMSSVMTGRYSSSHGVNLPNVRLAPEALTMAELLGAEGYRTGAIIGSFPLDAVFGLDQGFDEYDDEFTMAMIGSPDKPVEHLPSQSPETSTAEFGVQKFKSDSYRPDEDVTDAAIRWFEAFVAAGHAPSRFQALIDRLLGRRFFLWVHYFGPHEKLADNLGFREQEPAIVAAYDGDVEVADRAVGRLFDRLRDAGYLDDTLVILHADHGQNLGEFGQVGHGQRIDEATVRIPMILRHPGLFPGGVVRDDVARNVDILPTVLEATGLSASGLNGRSLLPRPGDPTGRTVPAEDQVAYFSTKLTTILLQPVPTPFHGAVLGPVDRSGMRTTKWRYVEDQVVGPCVHGGKVSMDAMAAWVMTGGKPLDEEVCRGVRGVYLYEVSPKGDDAPNVAAGNKPVLEDLGRKLRDHAAHVDPLGSTFTLSPKQEEKLRSLGYIK